MYLIVTVMTFTGSHTEPVDVQLPLNVCYNTRLKGHTVCVFVSLERTSLILLLLFYLLFSFQKKACREENIGTRRKIKNTV